MELMNFYSLMLPESNTFLMNNIYIYIFPDSWKDPNLQGSPKVLNSYGLKPAVSRVVPNQGMNYDMISSRSELLLVTFLSLFCLSLTKGQSREGLHIRRCSCQHSAPCP